MPHYRTFTQSETQHQPRLQERGHSFRPYGILYIPFLLSLFVIATIGSVRSVRSGTTFTINSTIDATDANPSDGICATASGECTLRAAIQTANVLSGADTIILPAATYMLSFVPVGENDTASGDLNVTGDLTLSGAGAAVTHIDGGDKDRVIAVSMGSVVYISNLTIRNGDSDPRTGAGIYNGGMLELSNTTISGNTTGRGVGGGIINRGTLKIMRSTISNNAAGLGGGIYNFEGYSLTVIDSSISNNTPTGIFNDNNSTVTIINSTISGNTAQQGAGIQNYGTGTITISNSTISSNTATNAFGGGVDNHGTGTVTLSNSTIYGNGAKMAGGGINNGSNGIVRLKNTLVADSTSGGNCAGTIISEGYNLDSGSTCNFTSTGDRSNTNAGLGILQNNGGPTLTHALLEGSPAIDTGSNEACPDVDQRGVSRPRDGDANGTTNCDIGAVEIAPQTAPTPIPTRHHLYLPLLLR